LRHRKKKKSSSPKHIRAQKRTSNAYKVPSKTARRLTAATIVLAVIAGSGTAFWFIHKVNELRRGLTGAVSQPSTYSPGQNNLSGVGSTPSNQTSSAGGGANVTKGASTPQPTVSPGGKPAQTATPGHSIPAKTSDTELPDRPQILQAMMRKPIPDSALIHLPAMSQMPQLRNGCEITSLSMLLTYVGHPVSKMALAAEEPRDETPLVTDKSTKKILYWGNPNIGFVGSVGGQKKWGYGIYHGPLTQLVNEYLPKRGLDLTGAPFQTLESIVAGGTPVEIWDTSTFAPTTDWVTWQSPEGPVHATFYEHAVLMVGYDQNFVFINNPLNGKAAQRVPIAPFIKAWEQLGQQAVTVAPRAFKE
jgi:uncharacterized protein YvpB